MKTTRNLFSLTLWPAATLLWSYLSASPGAAAVRYVNVSNANPEPPYNTWATAATTIQEAIDLALDGDEVLVTNGVYQTGGQAVYGTMTNRVAVTKPVTVRSVNGPEMTVIRGYQVPGVTNGDGAVRCVYLTNGSALVGFTLTNGATGFAGDRRGQDGSGALCESTSAVVSNCVLTGNSAGGAGGGSSSGTLNNCTLTGNSSFVGGGVHGGVINNCILTSNSAGSGGGSADGTLNNCILTGNSATYYGGGCYGGALNNCILKGNSGDRGGGGFQGTLSNCELSSNSATFGGGAYLSRLNNCTLTDNSAGDSGGAAFDGNLSNSVLSGNSAAGRGGGACNGMLNNCIVSSNWAGIGGGVSDCTVNNSTFMGNWSDSGGGAFDCALTNCALTSNSAQYGGGGAYLGTLNNCTLTGNSARGTGGGAWQCSLNNCIVYYNTAGPGGTPNYDSGTLNYCCTTPLPPNGVGNIVAEPQLASASHLSAGSPCRGAGSAAYSSGLDIDGEPWASPPSIGCDDYHVGTLTGLPAVAIQASYINVVPGFAANFVAQVGGNVNASRWEYGDGTVVSNQPYASHAWASVGDYLTVLRAYNESYPEGVTATVTVHVVAPPVHYVALESGKPVAPYDSWTTAARNIQDAVDATRVAGALVLVSNGVYQTGGKAVYGTITNRLAVTKPVTVRSVNGPELTVIRGYQLPSVTNGDAAVRCVYLTTGAALVGFTLTNGATRAFGDYLESNGGGVWCESVRAVVSNCTLVGNSAGSDGGGASFGTLNSCVLANNSAEVGGGASGATLNNCTLNANSAIYSGGGVYGCILNNCIVYYNTSSLVLGSDNYIASTLSYCCTWPQPNAGLGNFTNAPVLVDQLHDNLRLRSTSPCINAGRNAYASPGLDLGGQPRIVGGTVDLGAYEFQTPSSLLSYAWLQQYGLPTDGSADYADADGDQFNNVQEWRAGTDPTDALSALRLFTPVLGPSGVELSWQSVDGRVYSVDRSTNQAPVFQRWMSNIVGLAGTTTVTDTNGPGSDPALYRVGLQE